MFTEKVFGFITGTAFALRAESRSPSHRNTVRLPTGIAFDFTRIRRPKSPVAFTMCLPLDWAN